MLIVFVRAFVSVNVLCTHVGYVSKSVCVCMKERESKYVWMYDIAVLNRVLYFGVLLCDACFGPVYWPPSMLCPAARAGMGWEKRVL